MKADGKEDEWKKLLSVCGFLLSVLGYSSCYLLPFAFMKKLSLLSALGALALLLPLSAAPTSDSLYDLPLKDIDGKETTLKPYKGEVMLIVNVASKCGNTPQYAALEKNFEKYKDQGFVVLGFPCNQFMSQEPGTNAQIKEFCTETYGVVFPMFDKLEVNGTGRSPLYTQLAGPGSPFPGDIKWNFTKFLVGRDGNILARFEPKTKPDAPEVTKAIEAALAVK